MYRISELKILVAIQILEIHTSAPYEIPGSFVEIKWLWRNAHSMAAFNFHFRLGSVLRLRDVFARTRSLKGALNRFEAMFIRIRINKHIEGCHSQRLTMHIILLLLVLVCAVHSQLSDRVLRVATVSESPFVFVDCSMSGNAKFSGFSVDFANELFRRMALPNVSLSWFESPDPSYGALLPDGRWTGVAGKRTTRSILNGFFLMRYL